eukprot:CAMPEP_0167809636 /NCGR_PEP_ID=MMETSP0111_2-20121227/23912_1 /TAXON_ID=91324 /ORGANISM="Lotharella globosa, Strain CCCM811" /LENGTH=293 /DNA_ID=CAMNT_0007708059 /DNA_START=284 /DNA_END=1165 /DNA_ORIENTATION=+
MNYGAAIADTIVQLPLLCSGLVGLVLNTAWAEECLLAAAGMTIQWPVSWLITMAKAEELTAEWAIPKKDQVFHFFLLVPIAFLGFSYIVYVTERRRRASTESGEKAQHCRHVGMFAATRAYDPEYWLVCLVAILTVFGMDLIVNFCFLSGDPTDWAHTTRVVWAYFYGWMTAAAVVFTPMLFVGIVASLITDASSWWRTLVTPVAGVAIYAPVVFLAGMMTARGIDGFDFNRFSTQHTWMALTLVEVWGLFWMTLRLMRVSALPVQHEKGEGQALLAEESKHSGGLPPMLGHL